MRTDETRQAVTQPSVKILIVEDSPTQALKLQGTLEQHDYQITVARNGKEALTALQAYTPTIIISDIMMPEMDGYELCRRIKADEHLKNIPVILLTSLSNPQDVIKGLECGANNFIIKPWDEQFLLARIRYTLANQELRAFNTSDSTTGSADVGVEIVFQGKKYRLTSDRMQMLDLLLSTYETAVQKNIELKQANEALQHRTAELTTIVATQQEIATADLDLGAAMHLIVERAQQITAAGGAVLELVEGDEMVFRAASGTAAPYLGLRLNIASSLSGQCIRTGEVLRCDDAKTDSRVDREACHRIGLRSMIVVPLQHDDQTIGVLKVLSAQAEAFNERDVQTLQLMAGLIGAFMQRVRAQETRFQLATIVESSGDAIYSRALDDVILSWNAGAQRLYGYSAAEMLGRSGSILLPPDRADEIRQLLYRIEMGEHIEPFESVRVRKDGRQVAVSLSPVLTIFGPEFLHFKQLSKA